MVVAGVAIVVVDGDLSLVPAAVVLERVENVLTVGVDEIGPRLPERVNDVVDEPDLNRQHHATSVRALTAESTPCLKNSGHFCSLNSSVKHWLILIIIGKQHHQ